MQSPIHAAALTHGDRRPIAAKLTPPASATPPVPRDALTRAICDAGGVRLVLVRAAAGFGKTTLMRECLKVFVGQGVSAGWITLDRADNDASRFLRVLKAALADLAGPDETAVPSPAETGSTALALLEQVAAQSTPFVLFIDEYDVIQEARVHTLVRELIEAVPRHSRLVIGTRRMPDMRLARLRAQGELLEVDSGQLRFSVAETERFLGLRGIPPLENEWLERLHSKTEGWVAALWLAAIALARAPDRHAFIDAFSGSDRSVAEYLADEVLSQQSAEVQDFLRCTSVLRELDPSLSDHVLGRTGSAQVLEQLEKSSTLLHRQGDIGPTYCYHSLFADFLRKELAPTRPDEVPVLHARAAQWYLAQGRPVPAIEHAVEGRDWPLAVQLLESHAPSLLAQGRTRMLSRWFEALPAHAYAERPLLAVLRMWATCFTRGARAALLLRAQAGLSAEDHPELLPHLGALDTVLLSMTDRHEEAYAAGRDALARLPTGNAFADMFLANTLSSVATVLGRHDEARRLLDAARRGQGHGGSSFNLMFSEVAEGRIDLEEGRLRQATARFRFALNAAAATAPGFHGNSWAGVMYGSMLYELNDLDPAWHLLHVYLPDARDVQLVPELIAGYWALSRISFHRGDIDQALLTIAELETFGHERELPRLVVSAHMERAWLLLHQGHHAAARAELERAENKALWKSLEGLHLTSNAEYYAVGLLRWEIHAGTPASAVRQLDQDIVRAQAEHRHRRALRLRFLRAIALHRDSRPAAAHAQLRTVLVDAAREGYMRLLLDEGAPAAALLRSFMEANRDQVGADPLLRDYIQRLAHAFGAAMSPAEPSAEPGALAEPVTRKELRVVKLLAEGYSNFAIAEKLFVSENTVRAHLRNVNAKLGTHNRTQAVAVARKLGLIE